MFTKFWKRKPPVARLNTARPSRPATVHDVQAIGSQLMEHWYALERKRARKKMLRWLGAFAVLGALVFYVMIWSDNDRVVLNHTSLDKPFVGVPGGKGTGLVAVMRISGSIDGDYLGDNSPENTVRVLRESFVQAEGQKNLAGVLLLIDSPGGGAAASAQLYRLTKRFRNSHPDIPVVAYISQSAYSGGYWAALGAEKIIADPVAVVANIGVIQRFFNTSKLGDAIGVTEEEVSTGPRKNAGSQWRNLSPDDRTMMSRAAQGFFEHFLENMSDSREIPIEILMREASEAQGSTSGAWFSAKDALARKLVNEIIPVEDFLEHEAPKFAAKKKFAEIDYVSLEKDKNEITDSIKKSSQAVAAGLLRALKQEAAQSSKSIRAE